MGFVKLFLVTCWITALVVPEGVASYTIPSTTNEELTKNINKWIAVLNNATRVLEDFVIQSETTDSPETLSRQSTVQDINQDNAVILAIGKLIHRGKREAASLLYSKAIEDMPVLTNRREEFIKRIVFNVYQRIVGTIVPDQIDVATFIDFITLEVNETGQICWWLSSLLEKMKEYDHLATFDGQHLVRVIKRLAILNANNDQDEKCNLKQLANKVSNELIEPSERLIVNMAESIQSNTSEEFLKDALKFSLIFDTTIEKLIPKAIGLNNTNNETNENLVERLEYTIRFISSLSSSTMAIDALAHLNQVLHNVKPYYIPVSERIRLGENIKKLLTAIGKASSKLPLKYQQKSSQLKSSLFFNLKKKFWDQNIFIYKRGKPNSEINQFLTTSKSKRLSSTLRFARFEESDTTEESNQWILEPINEIGKFLIKNKESGEYLFADDQSILDGFSNKRSVFTYKPEKESDMDSLGNRLVWVVTPAHRAATKSERFLIKNLHWKEYLDSNEAPLNQVYTWRNKVNPQKSARRWIISDGRDVEKHDTRLVCFYASSAAQREGDGRLTADNIDPTLCTHLIYSKARIDNNTFALTIGDEKIDIAEKGYEKIVALKQKNPQLKVMISLGGWNIGEKYKRLHSDPKNIRAFVWSAVDFLQRYKFDGIHFELQFLFSEDHKEGMTSLLMALSNAFRSRNLLLSVTVSPQSRAIREGYDFPRLIEILDFISVMTFRFHGDWEEDVRHHAILQRNSKNEWEGFTADGSVDNLILEGVPSNKIVLGIPFYGMSWALENDNETTPGAIGQQGVTPGKILKSKDEMAYNEICEVVRNDGWQVFQHPEQVMGPYAVSPIVPNNKRTWVGYDDPAMAAVKANYILSNELGGACVWDVSMDDFRNICGGGVNPMLNAIANTLGIKAPSSTTV